MATATSRRDQIKQRYIAAQDSATSNLNKLLTNRVCIGITGLSRSGKSSFITSLINQLKEYQRAQLSGFSPWLNHRIVAVKQHPLEDRFLPTFNYGGSLKALCQAPPRWPESTTDVSGLLLEIKYTSTKNFLGRRQTKSLFVELRDYPGEWLLDLPLLRQSFAEWSRLTHELLVAPLRKELAQPLIEQLGALNPDTILSANELNHYLEHYMRFLGDCREEHVSVIQPGRLLLPGRSGKELGFFPLLELGNRSAEQLEKLPEDRIYQQLSRRFERYKRDLVEPFFKRFIKPVDRQIILVDVLSALYAGPDHLRDLSHAIEHVSESFSYGQRSWFRSNIDKVIFAASKIDQVSARHHEAARHLLGSVVKAAMERVSYQEVDYKVQAFAAIRSTKFSEDQRGEFIMGRQQDGQAIGFIPPDIPSQIPTPEQFSELTRWSPPQLLPPDELAQQSHPVIPHIRLDQILEDLLGDLCR